MTTKKLFKLGTLLLAMTLVLGAVAFAQTTYYVNNQSGLNSYDGRFPAPTGFAGEGPKATIGNAIDAASTDDIISVAATGAPYVETVNATKKLVFTSTGGTPTINGLTVNIAAGVTFTGPFAVTANGTVTLTTGAVTGASNLTLGSGVTIARAAGSLDTAPTFGTTVHVTYSGTDKTIGPEIPTAIAVLGNLTVSGAMKVTVNRDVTMKGVLLVDNAGGELALGANILTISGSATHNNVGHVTSSAVGVGGLAINMTGGNVTFNPGIGRLPNLAVSADDAARTLTVNGPAEIRGNVNVSVGNVTLTSPTGANGVTGSIVNFGSGTVTVSAAMTVGGSVSNNATGIIAFGATNFTITGDVTNAGSGNITFGAGNQTLNGNLINSGTVSFTSTTSNRGNITFGAGNITVAGSVTNSGTVSFSGTTAAATGSNVGNISFGDGVISITGSVSNSKSIANTFAATSGTAGLLSDAGNIKFGATTSGVTIGGTVTNAPSLSGSMTVVDRGGINTSGNITFSNTSGAVAVTGLVSNLAASTFAPFTGATTRFTDNGLITFANTSGSATFTGGLANGTTGFTFAGTNPSGSIIFTGRTTGTVTVGTPAANANLVNSSSSSGHASKNGSIDLRAAATGAVTVNGNVSLEGPSGNNDIRFGTNTTVTGSVTNSRATAGATVQFNSVATGAGNVSLTSVTQSGAGSISFPVITDATVTLTSGLTVSAGSFSVVGTGALNLSGHVTLTGGTFDAGGPRTVNFTGSAMSIATGVTLASNAGTILEFNRPNGTQSITCGIGIVWPGHLTINNTFPVPERVSLESGNLTVSGNVTFAAAGGNPPQVNIANNYLIVGGNFVNNSGYTGGPNGFVSMQGTGAQTIDGTASFFNIDVNNTSGSDVTFTDGDNTNARTYVVTGTFGLAAGVVAVGQGDMDANDDVISFNNATTPPTIVRNAGNFKADSPPTFTSNVHVTYIGGTKTFSNEVPSGGDAGKLRNMTVATTGTSTVTVNVDFTVGGTLTVNSGQTLALVDRNLTMNGASIVNNGKITSTTGVVTLNRAAGTAVTGAGELPHITVGNASSGNAISGSVGLIGDLILNGGGAAGKITLGFTGDGLGTPKRHISGKIATNGVNNTVTLAAPLILGGNLEHGGGGIELGSSNLTVRGTTNSTTAGATVTGTGKLIFVATGATTLAVNGGAAAIAAPVEVSLNLAATTFTVTTNALTLADAVTLTKGNLALNQPVTLTGNALGLTDSSSVTGAGMLTFSPAAGTLTVTLAGATSLENVTVAGSTTLAGAAGTFTVTGSLTHSAGVLNFAARDIALTGTATFTRTGGTYAATTGYLVYNSTGAFTPGTGFSIPNLRVSADLTPAGTASFVVSSTLDLRAVLTHAPAGSPRLVLGVAAGAIPTIIIGALAGNLDVAPTFAQGKANYTFAGTAAGNLTISGTYWPTADTALANNVTVSRSALTDTVTVGASRVINGNLTLTRGTLRIASAQTLRMARPAAPAAPTTLSRTAFARMAGPGTFSAAEVNVTYAVLSASPTVDAVGTTGIEYSSPTLINNLTVGSRVTVTLNAARTISGLATFTGTPTIGAATTVVGNVSIASGVTVALVSNLSVQANVTMTGTASWSGAGAVVFAGSENQSLTMSATTSVANLTIAQTADKQVNIIGGSLTVTGTLTLTRGVLRLPTLGTFVLRLEGPFIRPGTNLSHVVGRVVRPAGAAGRYEFPVGTLTQYRPAVFTFGTAPLVDLTVMHVAASPEGTAGLPIANAVAPGVDVQRYPDFYWLLRSSGSLGAITFNLELTAEGFTGYGVITDVRMIRRFDGDISNEWRLQGTNYDNYVDANGIPTVTNVNSTGGINPVGSRFTYGLRSNLIVATPIPDQSLNLGVPGKFFKRSLAGIFSGATGTLTYTASSSNTAIASAGIVAPDTLLVTALAVGNATITVMARDVDGSTASTSFIVTVGPLSVGPGKELPTIYALDQNYPNPFNPSTAIKYALPKESTVKLSIFNMLGQEVATLLNGTQAAGYYEVVWDGRGNSGEVIAGGIYFYRIDAAPSDGSAAFTEMRKMVMLK